MPGQLARHPGQAAALELEAGEAAFCVARLMVHETSGARALHRTVLPMERITGTPLAKTPTMTPARAYVAPTEAQGPVKWRESVTARMPHLDETSALQLDQPKPLLITQRITAATTGQPLMMETTATPADATRFTYTLAPGPALTAATSARRQNL